MFRLSDLTGRLKRDEKPSNIYSSLLNQFDLEAPSFGRNRRRSSWFTHTTLLALSIMLGLTTGIGSAFASREVVPSPIAPIDQPASVEKAPASKEEVIGEQRVEATDLSDQIPVGVAEEKGDVAKWPKDQQAVVEATPAVEQLQPTPQEISDSHLQSTLPRSKEVPSNEQVPSHRLMPSTVMDQPIESHGKDQSQLQSQPKESTQQATEQNALIKETVNQQPKEMDHLKSDRQTIQGGQLPITATQHLNLALIGLCIACTGYVLLRRNKKAE